MFGISQHCCAGMFVTSTNNTTALLWPPAFQQCIRNIKMSLNNVQWHCLGSLSVLFSILFLLKFSSSGSSLTMLAPPFDLLPSWSPPLPSHHYQLCQQPKQCPLALFGLMVIFCSFVVFLFTNALPQACSTSTISSTTSPTTTVFATTVDQTTWQPTPPLSTTSPPCLGRSISMPLATWPCLHNIAMSPCPNGTSKCIPLGLRCVFFTVFLFY